MKNHLDIKKTLVDEIENRMLAHNSSKNKQSRVMSELHKQSHHKVGDSLNSLPFDAKSIKTLLNKKIKELKIEMPPGRVCLTKLFDSINLSVPTVSIIDCILYCRGPKMENSDPEEFEMDKLVQWFILNIRTFKHQRSEGVDPYWLEEQ